MLRILARPVVRRTLAVGAAVGVSAGGIYYFSKQPRTRPTPHNVVPETILRAADAAEKFGSSPETPATAAEEPAPAVEVESPPEIEPPFVYASRVVGYQTDALRTNESSMIIDDNSVGFSRSDTVVMSDSVDGYNSWTRTSNRTMALFMLFQGHNGLTTSYYLRTNFLDVLYEYLTELFAKYAPITPEHTHVDETHSVPTGYPPPEEINETLRQSFLSMDNTIVQQTLDQFWQNPSKRASAEQLAGARSGSSALVSFFESETRMLRVAHVGASRAVLGRRTNQRYKGQTLYEAIPLSNEHRPTSPSEMQRIAELHPGEDLDFLRSHPVTRSFGDAALKWGSDVQRRLHQEYLGDAPHPSLLTPPYIDASPEIHSIQVQNGDFLVLASDGLWNTLTEDEVIGLVGWFVNQLDAKKWTPPVQRSSLSTWNKFSFEERPTPTDIKRPDQLPVHNRQVSTADKTTMYQRWNTEKRFVNVDNNAATHLTRNAMGGADREMTDMLLNMPPGTPEAKRFKPELGVTVVFFNDIEEEEE